MVLCLISQHAWSKGSMPQSWYVLPEERAINEQKALALMEPDHEFSEDVDDLYAAQGDSFDLMLEESRYANKSQNFWNLYSIRSQLAVSAQGILGILALKGGLAVELRWYKKYDSYFRKKYSYFVDESANILLTSQMSQKNIDQTLTKISDIAHRSGKIKNKTLMLKGLRKTVFDARKMLLTVPNTSHEAWSPYRFRLRIAFDASGNIVPIELGGDLQIRLDWEINHALSNQQNTPKTTAEKSFHEIVQNFSQDMAVFIDTESFGAKWEVANFQVIIGQTAGGHIGVTKLKGMISGRLYFKRNPKYTMKHIEHKTDQQKFNFITDDLDHDKITYSQNHGINYVRDSHIQSPSHTIFHINRKRFRRGLRKAEKIASFFVSRAEKNNQKHWELSEIRTDYRLSISGELGIATLASYGEIRVTHVKKVW